MLTRIVFCSTILVLFLFSFGCGDDNNNETEFSATLSGANEVPPITTSATGSARFTHEQKNEVIHFTLDVTNISEAFKAGIHIGAAGAEGNIVATLFDGPFISGNFSGRLATGTIQPSNVSGISFDQLIADMNAGLAYVSVQTTQNPEGEIRGQIQRVN